MTSSSKVILIACGSFNPITPMHLRMFGKSINFVLFYSLKKLIFYHFKEIARDQIYLDEEEDVIGGVISPVHDEYRKQDLAESHHRLAMAKLALQSSNWIRLSDWETQQKGWTRTRLVLQQHQNILNSYLKEKKNNNYIPSWLPNDIKTCKNVQIRLLCGADVLESFKIPGLWKDEDVRFHQVFKNN